MPFVGHTLQCQSVLFDLHSLNNYYYNCTSMKTMYDHTGQCIIVICQLLLFSFNLGVCGVIIQYSDK